MAYVDKMLRYNEKKPRLALVPAALGEAAARAIDYGCQKYTRDDWRKAAPWTDVMDSLLRHAASFQEGQDNDDESGLCHLDHMAANLAFLTHFYKHKHGLDDRYKGQHDAIASGVGVAAALHDMSLTPYSTAAGNTTKEPLQ